MIFLFVTSHSFAIASIDVERIITTVFLGALLSAKPMHNGDIQSEDTLSDKRKTYEFQ